MIELHELIIPILIVLLSIQYTTVYSKIFDSSSLYSYETKKEFWISLIPLSLLVYALIAGYKKIIDLSEEFMKVYKKLK